LQQAEHRLQVCFPDVRRVSGCHAKLLAFGRRRMRSAIMLLTPEMCRAARALLDWKQHQLASAAGLSVDLVRRFEGGGVVRLPSVEAMLQALQDAGLEFIPAGGKSLKGGPGLRTIPMAEPEVAAAEEGVELKAPTLAASQIG
jgi:transcriptional regulator with XRE-family HTH domain